MRSTVESPPLSFSQFHVYRIRCLINTNSPMWNMLRAAAIVDRLREKCLSTTTTTNDVVCWGRGVQHIPIHRFVRLPHRSRARCVPLTIQYNLNQWARRVAGSNAMCKHDMTSSIWGWVFWSPTGLRLIVSRWSCERHANYSTNMRFIVGGKNPWACVLRFISVLSSSSEVLATLQREKVHERRLWFVWIFLRNKRIICEWILLAKAWNIDHDFGVHPPMEPSIEQNLFLQDKRISKKIRRMCAHKKALCDFDWFRSFCVPVTTNVIYILHIHKSCSFLAWENCEQACLLCVHIWTEYCLEIA